MHPDEIRMGTDYAYATPDVYMKYEEAVEYCLTNHNAPLPTITDIRQAEVIMLMQHLRIGGE